MARSDRDPGVPAAGEDRDPDILATEELAARLGLDVQTVRDLAAAGVLPGSHVGRRWLFSWNAVYTWIAGPGVPDGEVLSARQLGRRIGVSERVVVLACKRGELPGRKVGKQWRFAVQAVRRELSHAGGRPAGAAVGVDPRPVPAAGQAGGPAPG